MGNSDQGLAINSKTNLFGKAVLEKEHLEEIQNYIKKLEADNKRLSESNKGLENKVNHLENTAEELSLKNLDLSLDKERLNEEMESILDYMPNSEDFMNLKEYQKSLSYKGGAFSETYHMDSGELEDLYYLASILENGTNFTEEFIKKDEAVILFENERAIIQFEPDVYERNDGGTINQYIDYHLHVKVYDENNHLRKEYDLNEFMQDYKPELLEMKHRIECNELETERIELLTALENCSEIEISQKVKSELETLKSDIEYQLDLEDKRDRAVETKGITKESEKNRWSRENYTVELVDFDHDLKVFEVVQDDKVITTIYPSTIEDMNEMIKDLNDGADVNGWENGLGETVHIPDSNENIKVKNNGLDR